MVVSEVSAFALTFLYIVSSFDVILVFKNVHNRHEENLVGFLTDAGL